MRNVVPFRAPAKFAEFGIDWTRAAQTESERRLREAFLTYETSCGPNGLVSIVLLATVSRRAGSVADDLQAAADHAEILLGMKLPSWVASMQDSEPRPGESGDGYAQRMLDEKYPFWDRRRYARGAGSEYSQIKKWFDRGKK